MRVPITRSQRTGEYGDGGNSDMWDGHEARGCSSEDLGEEVWEPVDMGGFPTGLSLVKVCLRTVAKDPEIILLQILSFTFSLSVLVLYLWLILGDLSEDTLTEALANPVLYVVLFPYLIIAGAGGIFFRAASMAIASIRLRGGDPVAGDGIAAAGRRVHLIIAWAVITAVVTVLVEIFRRKAKGGTRLVVEGANLAWGIATYFVVPVMLFENCGPIDAIERSTSIMRRTWRETIAGEFGLGMVQLAVAFPGIFLYPLGAAVWGTEGGIGLVFAYWLVVGLVFGAVRSVLIAALYEVAVVGTRPAGFDGYYDLSAAFMRIPRLGDPPGPRTPETIRDRQMMYVRR